MIVGTNVESFIPIERDNLKGEIESLLEDPVKTLETLNKVGMQLEFKLNSLRPEIEKLKSDIMKNGTDDIIVLVDKISRAENIEELDTIGVELDVLIDGHKKAAMDVIMSNPDLVDYIKEFK